ncbi:MAG: hypothetical protein IPK21_21590 [Haliscomenobacter sp.]|nr:hypothetical protein [Haliscomenobacter sp.]
MPPSGLPLGSKWPPSGTAGEKIGAKRSTKKKMDRNHKLFILDKYEAFRRFRPFIAGKMM